MPIPSRSKSVGGLSKHDYAPSSSVTHVGTSYLANLRSTSRGKRSYDMVCPGTEATRMASHASADLLYSHSAGLRASHRRKTIASLRPSTIKEEAGEGEAQTQFSIPTHQENQLFSRQVLGGLQYKPSTTDRKPIRSRNSLDNADVAHSRHLRKLNPEPTPEDGTEAQADRIRVFVRLRPMSAKERESGARCCVRAANKREIYLTELAIESDYLRLKRLKGRYFAFDGSFPDNTCQEEIYHASTALLVEAVLEGRNSSIFCYGATGAGKTYTMLGTYHSPGVMVLALKDLFLKLRQRSRDGEYMVRLSYLEVYNETVRDLLSPGRALILREDAKQGIVATGVTQYQATSTDEVMALLQRGNQNRTTEPTRLNETSSRSHAILQVVVVEYRAYVDSRFVTRTGKLSLIDLAGSERAIATDQRTIRSLEGANINRSLLALSSCISALVEGKKHIPYRNSKLTQLLKDSLGGACQTAMIANISPSNLSFGETQNTLYWADRAKEIQTKGAMANEEIGLIETPSEQLQLLLDVQKENQQLRMQVAQLQRRVLELENDSLTATPVAQQYPASCSVERVLTANKEKPETTGASSKQRLQYVTEKIEAHGMKKQLRNEDFLAQSPLTRSAAKRQILLQTPLVTTSPSVSTSGSCAVTRKGCYDYAGQKRTFWDITNTNSPLGKQIGRNTRNNTGVETPSLLLQPGFLRGHLSCFK